MVKRLFDIIVSFTGLIILSPVFLITGIVVYLKLGRPIFFKQERPGLHGKPYIVYKFRSMANKTDSNGNLLPDNERMTSFGLSLRNTSLDELPELLNVLKGDMSLVGPRPLLMKYLDHYTEKEKLRHNVRPGITGLAQINGRNKLCWDKRLELDVEYVEQRSFFLDLKILFITLKQIFSSDGVVANPRSEMKDLDDERRSSYIDD